MQYVLKVVTEQFAVLMPNVTDAGILKINF